MKFISICFLIFIFTLSISLNGYAQSAPEMLDEYFDLIVSGNHESAANYWYPASLERALKFGIEYDNISIKADCSSPVIRNYDIMKNYLTGSVKSSSNLKDNSTFKLELMAVIGSEKIQHYYYAWHDGSYLWLIYPQDYYCRDWEIKASKYFRVHIQPGHEKYLHEINLGEADLFIERICDSLDMTKDELKNIEDKKIEYYFCANDKKVEEITGFMMKGTYDLASNDIISAFFPHYHEIVHLLINYKLKKLPLYTLPLIREGTAVYLAGRWGKSPQTLMELGSYILKHQVVELDSILTMKNFEYHAASDIAYPISGLFISYLMDNLKMKNYFEFYRSFSGNFENINTLSTKDVQDRITASLKKTAWADVLLDFNKYIDKKLKENSDILPGKLEKGKVLFKNDYFTIKEDNKWIGFECRAQNDKSVEGNILFAYDENLLEIKSCLFEDQYNLRMKPMGFRYGVRYDQNEAGLYDYGTDHLLAKYIWGISPSEAFFDKENKVVCIKFRKSLFKNGFPSEDNFKLLAN